MVAASFSYGCSLFTTEDAVRLGGLAPWLHPPLHTVTPLLHAVAASVAYGCSLCRIRSQGVSELLLPDCHLLGEEALSGALGRLTLGCPGQLTVVDLGFCGRGLTPEVRPDPNPNPNPSPNPNPFAFLRLKQGAP